MENEAGGDHEGEEDIEADGDGEVWKTKVYGDPLPQVGVWLGGEVESNNAHHFGRGRNLDWGSRIFVKRYLQIEAM